MFISLTPDEKISRIGETICSTGYKIFPVTDSGLFQGKLLGIITGKDFDPRYDLELSVKERML